MMARMMSRSSPLVKKHSYISSFFARMHAGIGSDLLQIKDPKSDEMALFPTTASRFLLELIGQLKATSVICK